MPRFFVDKAAEVGESVFITGEDARHITKSLRTRPGEELTVCDGHGLDCLCRVCALDESCVELLVLSREESKSEPQTRVWLYQGYPKGDKLETIIEKCVELGVAGITPVLTERSVARPDDKSAAKKLEKWRRRALEAAKQCGRGAIPELEGLTRFSAMPSLMKRHELFICFYELGGAPLGELLSGDERDIGIFIGPEGGISVDEMDLLTENGAIASTLGQRILRTETAPLAALAAVMFARGEMS